MPAAATLTPAKWGPNDSTTDVSAAVATACTAGGDAFVLNGTEVLLVKNGDTGSHTVTITSQRNNFGTQNTADDLVTIIAAGKIGRIGPLSASKFRDSNGLAQVTYDAVTSMTAKVVTVAATQS